MSDQIPLSQMAMARPAGQPTSYLEGLNPEQKRAVETVDGPLLVLAGAGTGKTRVLTTRLAHIIRTGRAKPWQTLCVTFTNKAAREMRERAMNLIGPEGEGLRWLGTFHSISAQILRKHAELVGLKSTFTIIDTDDQIRLCKQIIEAEGIDPKRWTPRFMAGLIDGWKNRALLPGKVPPDEAYQFADGKGIKVYDIYQKRLSVLNACDFGDLLLLTIRLFQENPDVLEEYHNKFRYILVDEYQDTNIAQYLWLRLLARGTGNICCVGDDDQSIYGWRGAEVTNILKFEQDFDGAEVIRLERNYRSTGHILAAASHIIQENRGRLGKTLWTEGEQGEKVQLRGIWDGEAEARLIGEDIEQWQRGGGQLADCAVLVRASWQMRAFEERFIMLGIPYKVIGGPRFFERAEIRDAMAYFRLIRSEDDDLAFERVVNQPKRGVGAASLQKLQAIAREDGRSLNTICRMVLQTDEVKGSAKRGLTSFMNHLDMWRDKHHAGISHTELAEQILDESGYTDMLRADRSPQAATRLDNLKELVNAMGQFDSLAAFLEHVQLVMDASTESGTDDEVQIITLHGAKGLEWPLVFLPGWEEEVFPSKRSIDENGNKGLEEERRLAYVGITRARQSCRISFVANRQIYGRWQSVIPSRFVDELPHENVEAVSETGYGQNQGYGSFGSSGFGGKTSDSFEDLGERSTYSSPGWQRMKKTERKRSAPPTIDGKAELIASSAPGKSSFKIGQRVFHIKFGYGRVEVIEGAKMTVEFEKAGTKKVIATFLEAA
ncbi:UvrD-helicase domain-containing protein [Ponticaulis sp.]|uniref:ATP-dependent helicase n=1 Tax=Ponticaulis sp. TaxID=2020902 RepID=UPI000B6D9EA0|nr:UvrD-helicase domain-containing protein [Ponticaulis sp.]MAJ08969.1 DNA helicase II [Ponticaulis sp.]RPG16764.1 MAG: DNA helicase II [Hyphomonadaceae bacterium TMED125]HBH88912.1 DNA helicase II [Hyphomonadaceae bacterium]|tara:strand:- start:7054 stop:9381 length:2328 start_codon:yes stop_codon:yes gene_type:complete